MYIHKYVLPGTKSEGDVKLRMNKEGENYIVLIVFEI